MARDCVWGSIQAGVGVVEGGGGWSSQGECLASFELLPRAKFSKEQRMLLEVLFVII